MALSLAAKHFPHLKAEDIVFFDDSTRNVCGASICGIRTVLVGTKGANTPALLEIESLHNLRVALPELWDLKGTIRLEPTFSLPARDHEVTVSAV